MITPKQYKKINNHRELEKSESNLIRWLHLYIRLRDLIKNDNGSIYGYCISCKKQIFVELFSDNSIRNGRQLHASHYFNSDKYASLRFEEDNLHLSCFNCNRMLSGNKDHYEINLRAKIGEERFNGLIIKKNQIKKWDIIEIEDLVKRYKQKAKLEAKRLGVKHY